MSGTRKPALFDEEVTYHLPADHVLVDDPFQRWRIAFAIPRTFRIDDSDRSAFADAEAIGLGPQHAALFGQTELLESSLEKIPGGEPALLVAALRIRLIAAEKDVPPCDRDAD